MNLNDPVDAAALRMYNETRAYLAMLDAGGEPDAMAMIEATAAYAAAVDASLKHEEKSMSSDDILLQVRLRSDGRVEVWQSEGRPLPEVAAILREMADGFESNSKQVG